MNLTQYYLTHNDCYKAGKKIKVKGLVLHSTGANNPKLSRYIGPDDGVLGVNKNDNDWNRSGISKCVHGFIGKDKNGDIRTYQTLPWNHRAWHVGGKGNDTHIGVEICEDGLTDASYFNAVYKEAVELFAYLCKKFNLTEKDIIDHSEAHKRGLGSNHGDVMHWFPKHGKSMNTFRADVKAHLGGETIFTPDEPKVTPQPSNKSIETLAQEVIRGEHGSGDARRKSLGSLYDAVQDRVNDILGGVSKSTPSKSIDQLAREVIDGKHGHGDARKKSLGSQYDAVQKRVNEILGVKPKGTSKSISQLADEVIRGVHGSGRERMISLGSNYAAVQKEVNRRMR